MGYRNKKENTPFEAAITSKETILNRMSHSGGQKNVDIRNVGPRESQGPEIFHIEAEDKSKSNEDIEIMKHGH